MQRICTVVKLDVPFCTVLVSITAGGNPTLGQQYTLTCSVVTGTPTVQWVGPVPITGGDFTVSSTSPHTLTINPLRQSHFGQYTCQATVGGDTGTASVIVDTTGWQLSLQSNYKMKGLPVSTLHPSLMKYRGKMIHFICLLHSVCGFMCFLFEVRSIMRIIYLTATAITCFFLWIAQNFLMLGSQHYSSQNVLQWHVHPCFTSLNFPFWRVRQVGTQHAKVQSCGTNYHHYIHPCSQSLDFPFWSRHATWKGSVLSLTYI